MQKGQMLFGRGGDGLGRRERREEGIKCLYFTFVTLRDVEGEEGATEREGRREGGYCRSRLNKESER